MHSEWSPQCLKDLSSSFYALLPANVWSAQYTRKGLRCTDLTAAILGNKEITYRLLENCVIDYNKTAPISKLPRLPLKSDRARIAECFVSWSRFIDLNVTDTPFLQINDNTESLIQVSNGIDPKKDIQIWQGTKINSGPCSVVGIETAYGLDGPGIESRWGRDFPHLSRPTLRPTQPPVQWVPGLSRG